MAAEIGPGTLLICVDVSPPANPAWDVLGLTLNAIYRVESFYDRVPCMKDGCGPLIRLVGRPTTHAFCRNRFKPLIDGDGVILEEEIKEPEHA